MLTGIYDMYVYIKINSVEIDLIHVFCRSRYSYAREGRSYGLYSGSGGCHWGAL